MYLQTTKANEKRKLFEYLFSDGLGNEYNTSGRRIISMKNISHLTHPSLAPKDPYYTWNIEGNIQSLGVIDGKVYYTRGQNFYFDGVSVGEVLRGKKQFLNFKNQVLIFPDNMFYDVESNTFGNLQTSVDTTLKFINTSLGINSIKSASSSVKLTDSFYEGQGILISGTGNKSVDGYHYITGVDKTNGILYFKNYEFGSADISDTPCVIYNEIPVMDSVCICQNRIWGVAGNKVYASKTGDPRAFCAFGKDGSDSFVCEHHDTDGFVFCMEYNGYPLIFSKSAIYKVYGDAAGNYELESICNRGGIDKNDILSVAQVDGEVFYLSYGEVVKFTGGKSERVASFPYKRMVNGVGCADRGAYYLSCNDENAENRLFVYNTQKDVWYEHEGVWINKTVRVNDALYGLSANKAYLLNIPSKYPTDTEHEGRVYSSVEFDDAFDLTENLYPDRIIVRGYTGTGGTLSFEILYDGDMIWQKIGEITDGFYGVYTLPISHRKCSSFKLRVNGLGYYCIKNLCVECVVG